MFSNIDADIVMYGYDHGGSIVHSNDKIVLGRDRGKIEDTLSKN